MLPFEKMVTRHRDFACKPCKMNRFPNKHNLFPPLSLMWPLVSLRSMHHCRSAQSWAQERGKRSDQGLLKLGLRSWVTWMSRFALPSISCFTKISRRSGLQVMWLLAPLSRIHLSLRSWLMSFMLWAHAFHGSTEEFSQWWKSHTLIVCLPFLGKRFGVFLLWGNVIEACSMPPRFRISRFVLAALRSVCCHKPWSVLALDFFSFASAAVFSGEIDC